MPRIAVDVACRRRCAQRQERARRRARPARTSGRRRRSSPPCRAARRRPRPRADRRATAPSGRDVDDDRGAARPRRRRCDGAGDSFVDRRLPHAVGRNLLWRGDDDAIVDGRSPAGGRRSPRPRRRRPSSITNEVGLGVHPETDARAPLPRPARPGQPDLGRALPSASLLLVAGRALRSTTLDRPRGSRRIAMDRDAGCTTRSSTCRRPTSRRGAAVHERAADILRPSGALALARRDRRVGGRLAAHRPRPRSTGRPALIFAADHGVAAADEGQRLPDRTSPRRCSPPTGRAGRRSARSPAIAGATVDGDRRRRRPADRRHPLRGGADAGALRRGRRRRGRRGRRARRATCSCSARWASATPQPSAAVAAALAGGETAAWVGRGTGVDDEGLARKRAAVQEAVRRIAGVTDPLEVLREVGGAELVGDRRGHRRRPPALDSRSCSTATSSPPPCCRSSLRRAGRRSTTASSATARPSPATAGCSSGSASGRCSTSTCASARAAGRWPPSRSSRWRAPASPRCRRSAEWFGE